MRGPLAVLGRPLFGGALALACSANDPASTAGPDGSVLGAVTVERVASWRGDARAAYPITHDDLCDTTTTGIFAHAEPELGSRGLRAAFGAIVASCASFSRWDDLNRLIANGHEIMNHGWGHKNLVTETRDFPLEVTQAKAELDLQLSRPAEFFIFPYDEFDEVAVQAVRDAGHLGARAGIRGLNDQSVYEFAVSWDTFGPEYSIYKDDPIKSQNILDALVDDAVASGSWAVRELHGVEDASWEPVPVAQYQAHLDHVKTLVDANQVWMEGPTTIIKYQRSVQLCGAPAVSASKLTFPSAGPDCARYSTPISVVVRTQVDVAMLLAVQAGQSLVTKKLGPMQFLIDVAPAGGDVELSGT